MLGRTDTHEHSRAWAAARTRTHLATTMRRAVGDPRLGALGPAGRGARNGRPRRPCCSRSARSGPTRRLGTSSRTQPPGGACDTMERRALLEIRRATGFVAPPRESPDVCPSGRKRRLLHATCTSWLYFGDRVRRCNGPGLRCILGAIRGPRRPVGRGRGPAVQRGDGNRRRPGPAEFPGMLR